jgi:hypothetical protein
MAIHRNRTPRIAHIADQQRLGADTLKGQRIEDVGSAPFAGG